MGLRPGQVWIHGYRSAPAGAPACPALAGTLYCFTAGLVFVEATSRAVWTLDLRGSSSSSRAVAAAAGGAVAAAAADGSSSGSGGGLQAITMQQLPVAAALALGGGGGGGEVGGGSGLSGTSLGEAVVFRGSGPACGLAPAAHLTVNTHLALALAAMSPVRAAGAGGGGGL